MTSPLCIICAIRALGMNVQSEHGRLRRRDVKEAASVRLKKINLRTSWSGHIRTARLLLVNAARSTGVNPGASFTRSSAVARPRARAAALSFEGHVEELIRSDHIAVEGEDGVLS